MNGKWLVQALMELVEKDNLIQDNAKFMAIPGGLPAYKQEFPEMHVVYIYNLLICDFFEKVVDDLILMC